MANGKPRIAFIGFGEAGQAIAAGLHDASAAQVTAWDILFPQGATSDKPRRAADASGVPLPPRRCGKPISSFSRSLRHRASKRRNR